MVVISLGVAPSWSLLYRCQVKILCIDHLHLHHDYTTLLHHHFTRSVLKLSRWVSQSLAKITFRASYYTQYYLPILILDLSRHKNFYLKSNWSDFITPLFGLRNAELSQLGPFSKLFSKPAINSKCNLATACIRTFPRISSQDCFWWGNWISPQRHCLVWIRSNFLSPLVLGGSECMLIEMLQMISFS